MPITATFSHLDLAHVAGAVAAKLAQDADVGVFESFDHEELAAHQRSLDRGVHILEVAIGALQPELSKDVMAALGDSVSKAESASVLIGRWLEKVE